MDYLQQSLEEEINKAANPKKAQDLQRFFKTGKGEYGEGDVFIGITVPRQREIAKKFIYLPFNALKYFITHRIHEYRLIGLLILIGKFKKSDESTKKEYYHFYLDHTQYINNWDLVDLSAPHIVGMYLLDKERTILKKLARSKLLWDRRIAIISTFTFIRHNEFVDTYKISEILLKDKHDLIHKGVGWMLREMGKYDRKIEEQFLEKYAHIMPRTMLRYAIEKFDEAKRKYYLHRS